ncbi:copper-activated transcription factor grisea [Diplodia corticola]|uniref:Copper-activated transcription factor grisea n=1 Tax=Diplodia corticola TaxID=236234 RepID=A0A1J9QXX9_9PEZI|nr:copper-activated transcription factor grisea [Diplodia corticola]OJD33225.1 copper-activated transcription factor grisea [Diplodia corticola]
MLNPSPLADLFNDRPCLASDCACPSNGEEPAPVAEVVSSTIGRLTGPSNRVQKSKRKSVSNSRNPASLEKAIKTAQDSEQKLETEAPKSCCSSKQPPATTGSSNTSPAPTSEGSSPSSHDDGPAYSESACCSSKATAEFQPRPLNVQLETRKQSTRSASAAQVQGWEHITVEGNSASKTFVEEPPSTKESCCGSGIATKKEAPIKQSNQRLNLAPQGDIYQQAPSQAISGNYSHMQSAQQPFGPNQQYPFYAGQHQFGNPMHNPTFSRAPPNSIHYATNGASPGQIASLYPFTVGAQLSEGFETNIPDVMHNCTCGDACACLGCAVHPRNETTLRHLQEVANFMIQDPFYANPSSPLCNDDNLHCQPAYPIPEPTNTASVDRPWQAGKIGQPYQQQSSFPPPGMPYPQDTNGGSFWPSSNGLTVRPTHATPSTEISHFTFQDSRDGQGAIRQENHNIQPGQLSYQRTTSYNSSVPNASFATPEPASSTAAAETPTLSPSSFFWQQVELPGCDDASGACRCGDGCQCVGCLTHGGHDGVPLAQSSGDYRSSSGFQSQAEQAQMNSIDGTLDTKLAG